MYSNYKINPFSASRSAEVAELVDALGSGSSGCMPVGVRVPPSAPTVLFCLCILLLKSSILFHVV